MPKLCTAAAARAPTGRPSTSAPTACAASSTMATPVGQRRRDLGHRRSDALDVGRDHRARARAERRRDRLAGHDQSARADAGDADAIAERAQKAGDAGGGVGGDDDLVAGAAAGVRQHRRHAGTRRADRDGMPRAEQCRGGGLELLEAAAAALDERGERAAITPERRWDAGAALALKRTSAGAHREDERARPRALSARSHNVPSIIPERARVSGPAETRCAYNPNKALVKGFRAFSLYGPRCSFPREAGEGQDGGPALRGKARMGGLPAGEGKILSERRGAARRCGAGCARRRGGC